SARGGRRFRGRVLAGRGDGVRDVRAGRPPPAVREAREAGEGHRLLVPEEVAGEGGPRAGRRGGGRGRVRGDPAAALAGQDERDRVVRGGADGPGGAAAAGVGARHAGDGVRGGRVVRGDRPLAQVGQGQRAHGAGGRIGAHRGG